ncbi:hypothetical protein GTW59_24975, partial [Streptomyces sp. SID89]|nr:hypothetical protein [Streptomyces sp. SID89]
PASPEQLAELRTLQDIVTFMAGAAAAEPVAASAAVSAPAAAAAGPDAATVTSALLDVVAQKTGYPAEMLDLGM